MKSRLLTTATLLAALAALAASAEAQQGHEGHGGMAAPAATIELPAICHVRTGHAGEHEIAPADTAAPLDPGHQALLDSMVDMHDTMMAAMSAEDVDVAFVCGMIPHHQGAIAMARAVIDHGDDPWTKKLAEQVIAVQEREIADMLEWLRQRM